MVKDGEDYHGLQSTTLKNAGQTFQDGNRDLAPLSKTTLLRKIKIQDIYSVLL